ncbi:MAG: biopolymer transporter ExbD [Bdellovibrionales bacterium]|nr:biopolymer transporter ExbD [Bdellovibrionales bacterium]
MAFNMGGGGDDTPMADINVIPLVDIMLVLLIISMVTAPFLEQGVNVELPVASGQSLQKTQTEAPIVLYVAKDRNLRLGETPITRAQLAEKLNEVFKNRASKELFVRADKEVPYGAVAEVMARVQAAGIERVGLVTLPDSQ